MPEIADFLFQITSLIRETAAQRLAEWGCGELADGIELERPAISKHGDYSTNIALVAAGRAKRPPRELASQLADDFSAARTLQPLLSHTEIAGPGFINFFLRPAALAGAVQTGITLGARFGSSLPAAPEKILLEFVSANPTGTLHVGHARYAAYGDALRRILEFAGHDVTSEFYINDYGTQMEIFGRTLAARYAQELGLGGKIPDEGYQGEYPRHVAKLIAEEAGDRFAGEMTPEPTPAALSFFRQRGCELVLGEMRAELERFRVGFDSWFSESRLYSSGEAEAAIEELKRAGEAVEREGALWLLTTRYGDDKDRVLIRGSGEPTYFASDIAYHRDKLERGYDRLINIWGADHHGYVPRMKAAFEALAHDPERLEIIIGQLVNLIQMGERRQMSKRAGTMVTLAELVDGIGVDAARFFLVDRSHDTTLDLDMEKAKLKSEENPVYYVQYAHARICSILRKSETGGEAGVETGGEEEPAGATQTAAGGPFSLQPQERELILKQADFPAVVRAAAITRSPQRLTTYARELAAVFHVFYHNCPVLRADPGTAAFRLDLCRLTRYVIARSLDLVGVAAPEKM